MCSASLAPGRPLKVGVIVPTLSVLTGSTVSSSALIDFARVAEDAGFDTLWVPDHLLFSGGDGDDPGAWEGWSMLSALAAGTHRIELGSFVTCTGLRNPALLAKMADTVDEISRGRLILNFGAGWLEAGYLAFGYPFDHRVSRFEEAVAIINGLLRTGHVVFAGNFYQARDCTLRPHGPRPDGPPIMIGSSGPRMLRLVAQYAEMWNVFFDEEGTGNRVERIPPLQMAVDAACVAKGRDPATLARSAGVLVRTSAAVPEPPTADTAVGGAPEELADALRAYAAQGIGHVQLMLDPITPAGLAACAPDLELLDRE